MLGKVTMTSIIEDFRKENPPADLPSSVLSCLQAGKFITA
jgi:hypothetical protein